MKRAADQILFSPTDLTKHLACAHITTLDLAVLEGRLAAPESEDEALNLVFAKGASHEDAYLERLRAQGLTIAEIDTDQSLAAAEADTLAAMRAGVEVIYQAALQEGLWRGYADFLRRVDTPSELGDYSYEVYDTKLSRRLKVPALLQMATYAERLAQLQGVLPARLWVVTGDGVEHPWRTLDVQEYAARARARLEAAVRDRAPTEPRRVQHCQQCRWADKCADEWRAADDLVLVPGMRADHRDALRAEGVTTVAALGALVDVSGAVEPVAGIRASVLERLAAQARLQVAERVGGEALFELREPSERKGLAALPEPDPGDVYLDFEGDPWAADGQGREYLAGICDRDRTYTEFWAHDAAEEAKLAQDLLDWLVARAERFPHMHIYHYAPYEVTALKRLTARYARGESQLDQLLRATRFVDLYAVVKDGIRIGKESYSIKKLEALYWDHTRSAAEGEVADGLSSVVEYEKWLETRDQTILDAIRAYNIVDVESTLDLHDWLEHRRDELVALAGDPGRPTSADIAEVGEAELAEQALIDELHAAHAAGGSSELVTFADLISFHRREARPKWWAVFHSATLQTDELVDVDYALAGLSGPERVGEVRQSAIWRYTAPAQQIAISRGKSVFCVDTQVGAGTVHDVSEHGDWIELTRAKRLEPLHPRAVMDKSVIRDDVLRDSIATAARAELIGNDTLAARLLRHEVPSATAFEAAGSVGADAVVALGSNLRGAVLAVQGPPGTGKTYAGSQLIQRLYDEGKRVGVVAQSHAVLTHLLESVDRPSVRKPGADSEFDQFPDDPHQPGVTRVEQASLIEHLANARATGVGAIAGGTAWLWARPELEGSIDVLVIEEAGQFSLANAVAVAQAAQSMVLLGDPQQLPMVTQAAHPGVSGESVLGYLLDGAETIPDGRGVFLP